MPSFQDLCHPPNCKAIGLIGNLPTTELMVDHYQRPLTPHPCFVALDSHPLRRRQLEEAYQRGIRQFVIEEPLAHHVKDHLPLASILQVQDAKLLLKAWLKAKRARYTHPLLAIIGIGQTTKIKAWITKALAEPYHLLSTPYRQTHFQGIARTLSLLDQSHNYATIEIDGDLHTTIPDLLPWLQPTACLLAYSAHHTDTTDQRIWHQSIETSLQLLHPSQTIFYSKANPWIEQAIQANYKDCKRITWDFKPPADYIITYKTQKQHIHIAIDGKKQHYHTTLPSMQPADLHDYIQCMVYLLEDQCPKEQLDKLSCQWHALPYHPSSIATSDTCQVTTDPYHHDLLGLSSLLDRTKSNHANKTVILDDIPQHCWNEKYYQSLSHLLSQHGIQRLITIGANPEPHRWLFQQDVTHCQTPKALLDHDLPRSNHHVVIKSHNPEPIVEIFKSKIHPCHPTTLTMHMGHMLDNLNHLKSRLQPTTKILLMLKANAYGHGLIPIGSYMEQRIDYIGVTFPHEAIILRQCGITTPIMVTMLEPQHLDCCLDYQLEPVIYSLPCLKSALAWISQNHIQNFPVHIKLDTGMNRLGIKPQELPMAIQYLKACSQIDIVSLFSHLPAASFAAFGQATEEQAALFAQMTRRIEDDLAISPLKHLLNSGGILHFPHLQYDMVRLGIGLYRQYLGEPQLKDTAWLTTHIVQTKRVQPGDMIGYNGQAIAQKATTIAILPIGYADGMGKRWGLGRSQVIIQGQLCPTVGEICMDITMVDISGLDAKPGDQAIILSPTHGLDKLPLAEGISSYEFLSQIGPRIARRYIW